MGYFSHSTIQSIEVEYWAAVDSCHSDLFQGLGIGMAGVHPHTNLDNCNLHLKVNYWHQLAAAHSFLALFQAPPIPSYCEDCLPASVYGRNVDSFSPRKSWGYFLYGSTYISLTL